MKCKTAVKIQLVLPVKYKETVLTASHDEMGHQGMDQTSSLIGEIFLATVQRILSILSLSCSCIKNKKPRKQTGAYSLA